MRITDIPVFVGRPRLTGVQLSELDFRLADAVARASGPEISITAQDLSEIHAALSDMRDLQDAVTVLRDRAFAAVQFAHAVGADEPTTAREDAVKVIDLNGQAIRATDALDQTCRASDEWHHQSYARLSVLGRRARNEGERWNGPRR